MLPSIFNIDIRTIQGGVEKVNATHINGSTVGGYLLHIPRHDAETACVYIHVLDVFRAQICIGLMCAPPDPSLRTPRSAYTKKETVYTFTLDERYPAFVNDTSTEQGIEKEASDRAS